MKKEDIEKYVRCSIVANTKKVLSSEIGEVKPLSKKASAIRKILDNGANTGCVYPSQLASILSLILGEKIELKNLSQLPVWSCIIPSVNCGGMKAGKTYLVLPSSYTIDETGFKYDGISIHGNYKSADLGETKAFLKLMKSGAYTAILGAGYNGWSTPIEISDNNEDEDEDNDDDC